MARTYAVKGESEAKKAATEAKAEAAESAGLGPYTGGPIASRDQLVRGLRAKKVVERLLKEFDKHARVWVVENGSVEDEGQVWGPAVKQREKGVSMKLEELTKLLAKCGVSEEHVAAVEAELRFDGVGELTTYEEFRWTNR